MQHLLNKLMILLNCMGYVEILFGLVEIYLTMITMGESNTLLFFLYKAEK